MVTHLRVVNAQRFLYSAVITIVRIRVKAMDISTNTDFYKAVIPTDPGAAYRFIRESAPSLLRLYDEKVLHGYDIGKELSYYLKDDEKFEGICRDIFTELKAVALRDAMPCLPIERVNQSEMHLYSLRHIFHSILKGTADLVWLKYNGAPVPEKYFNKNSAVLSEIYVTMMRLVKHANEIPNADPDLH